MRFLSPSAEGVRRERDQRPLAVPGSGKSDFSMSYAVKEIFYTLQGEGAQAGRPAVFCRFAGCNLWSGRAIDRSTAACQFCDTDFVGVDGPGGGKFESAQDLAVAVERAWAENSRQNGSRLGKRFVVCTGGEP